MQVKHGVYAFWGADYVAPREDAMSATRTSCHGLERLRATLSERDLVVLGSIARFRFLSARQIERLHFHSHASTLSGARACRRDLARLAERRLLVRLERRVGGIRAGSASHVYALGLIGHRLLFDNQTRRWREPSAYFVDHTLATAQVMIELSEAERSGRVELVDYRTEPTCWRNFTDGIGVQAELKPDLSVVTADAESEWSWFVEVDLGTESGPTITRKCQIYTGYWQTGIEQHQTGVFPRVVWIAPNQRRAEFITKAIAKTGTLQRELFTVTTVEDATTVLIGGAP